MAASIKSARGSKDSFAERNNKMSPIVLIIISLSIALLLWILLWIFIVHPRFPAKDLGDMKKYYYAHRGLHGDGISENTIDAFRNAAEHGFGIELDVRISSDGYAVVNHDRTLDRVFGKNISVSQASREELSREGVPSMKDVLREIQGRVPLLIEIKSEEPDTSVCEALASELDGYNGAFAVQSFNPFMIKWFRKNRPDIIRGQLSSNFQRDRDAFNPFLSFMVRHLWSNFITRPDFISYRHCYYRCAALNLCRALGAVTFAWTIRSASELSDAKAHGFDVPIFESFLPELQHIDNGGI